MHNNYFKIAIRNIFKNKFYSALNILGLSIGIASFLFILIYAQEELSYDQYHLDADRIVRIDFHARLGENEFISANNSAPIGPALAEEYPEVESFCRFRDKGSYLIKYEENHFKEEDIIYTDSTFFQFFSIPILHGNPNEVLTKPHSIVLSEKMAYKYFGSEDPIGKTLILDNEERVEVTGIMSNIPSNTHFQYDFLISMSTLDESRENNYGSNNFTKYVENFQIGEKSDQASTQKEAYSVIQNGIPDYISMKTEVDKISQPNPFDKLKKFYGILSML